MHVEGGEGPRVGHFAGEDAVVRDRELADGDAAALQVRERLLHAPAAQEQPGIGKV